MTRIYITVAREDFVWHGIPFLQGQFLDLTEDEYMALYPAGKVAESSGVDTLDSALGGDNLTAGQYRQGRPDDVTPNLTVLD